MRNVRHLLGYCPQFDTLIELLTAREHLIASPYTCLRRLRSAAAAAAAAAAAPQPRQRWRGRGCMRRQPLLQWRCVWLQLGFGVGSGLGFFLISTLALALIRLWLVLWLGCLKVCLASSEDKHLIE